MGKFVMGNCKVTRRRVLRGAAVAGGLASVAASGNILRAARAQSARKTFVLVHGTFCGSWTWRRVADQLEQRGHKIFVPTLSGLGERSHLLKKDIDLDTHILDVVNLVKWESLDDVCLVVHSYGGWIGSGALEEIGNRVSSIVWLDAFMPTNGQKPLDLTNEAFRKIAQTALDKGDVSFAPPPKIPVIFVAERDQTFVESKLTPHPIGTYLQPIKLSGAREKIAKKTYIRIPKFPQPAFDTAMAQCKADKSWATFEVPDAGHIAMLDAPDRVTQLILQAA
jgi:pimeloyl-ACP methyl ester carboxylesterase